MTVPKLVYVAGPIQGNPFGCVRQAIPVFTALREIGAVPFLPQLSILHAIIEDPGYEAWLVYDFDVIRLADCLIRLPGVSPGADQEVGFATRLGKPVFAWPLVGAARVWLTS